MESIIGNKYKNNYNQEYEVVCENGRTPSGNKKYLIRFLETGYERTIEKAEIKRGKIKDKLSTSLFDIGVLGNVKMVDHKREYSIWSGMLERCYDKNSKAYKSYGAKGVTVCDRWHYFENFLDDIQKVEGYDSRRFEDGKLNLDKDKKQFKNSPDTKVYSLETCTFLSFEENNIYRDNDHRKKSFYGISPNGDIVEVFGLKEFSRENNLIRQGVTNCLTGRAQTHKGWRFSYEKQLLTSIR